MWAENLSGRNRRGGEAGAFAARPQLRTLQPHGTAGMAEQIMPCGDH